MTDQQGGVLELELFWNLLFYYPVHACAARGYVIGRGVYILYIVYCILSPKILTFRGLF